MKIMTVWNWLGSVFSHDRRDQIIIRQTLDPYVNIPYVAWRKVTLESNGDLCMGKIGLGMPGDKFVVRHTSILYFQLLTVVCGTDRMP